MNDVEPSGAYVPSRVLSKQGVRAVAGIIGGAALLVLGRLPFLPALIAGAVVAVVGLSAVFSKDPEDKFPGALVSASGALLVFSKVGIAKVPAGLLLGLLSLGLLGMGIWNGIKFLKGLKERS
jgi:hypothetical protein